MIAAMYADYQSLDVWAARMLLVGCGLLALVGALMAWARRGR